jgi:hypothetical protein
MKALDERLVGNFMRVPSYHLNSQIKPSVTKSGTSRHCIPPMRCDMKHITTNEVFLSKMLNLNLIKPLEPTSIYRKYGV